MNICQLPPVSSSYAGAQSSPVIETQLAGGGPRLRLDQLGIVGEVNCRWICDPLGYEYLQSFYRSVGYGSQPFQIGLILDTATVDPYTVTIKPGSWALASQVGFTYVQTASLMVVPNAANATFDQSVVDVYGSYLDGSSSLLAALAELATIGLTLL